MVYKTLQGNQAHPDAAPLRAGTDTPPARGRECSSSVARQSVPETHRRRAHLHTLEDRVAHLGFLSRPRRSARSGCNTDGPTLRLRPRFSCECLQVPRSSPRLRRWHTEDRPQYGGRETVARMGSGASGRQMGGRFHAFRSRRYHCPHRRHLFHRRALARSTFSCYPFSSCRPFLYFGGCDYRCDGRSGPCVTPEPP